MDSKDRGAVGGCGGARPAGAGSTTGEGGAGAGGAEVLGKAGGNRVKGQVMQPCGLPEWSKGHWSHYPSEFD